MRISNIRKKKAEGLTISKGKPHITWTGSCWASYRGQHNNLNIHAQFFCQMMNGCDAIRMSPNRF